MYCCKMHGLMKQKSTSIREMDREQCVHAHSKYTGGCNRTSKGCIFHMDLSIVI